MKIREEFTCPLELVHDMMKGKWKPIILWRLRLGATSLAKLERDIDGITQKMHRRVHVPSRLFWRIRTHILLRAALYGFIG